MNIIERELKKIHLKQYLHLKRKGLSHEKAIARMPKTVSHQIERWIEEENINKNQIDTVSKTRSAVEFIIVVFIIVALLLIKAWMK